MESKGGQVRKLHIIYFLSRLGQVEQPHLFRVHHLTAGGGVYLRDVKRWLADLRGKDMPEAFSWSYKRKYKTGYVWQDLVDDDLITPISDNEYVLQGSEIIPSSMFDSRISSSSQRRTPIFREEEDKPQQPTSPTEDFQRNLDATKVKNPQKFSGFDRMNKSESSSERSTITDDYESMKLEEESKQLETPKPERRGEEEVEKFKNQYASLYSRLLKKETKKKMKDKDKDKDSMEKEGTPTTTSSTSFSSSSSSSHSGSFTKSKSNSNGASNMLRHWITCSAVDTKDTVLIKNPSAKDASNQLPAEQPKNEAEICREKLGGSARVFRTCLDQQLEIPQQQRLQSPRKSCDGGMDSRKKRQKECSSRKVASAAVYKPMGGPNCSQCGKTFRPEKMHAHMKSCRGLKSLAKAASTSDKALSKSMTSTSHKESVSGYLLTN